MNVEEHNLTIEGPTEIAEYFSPELNKHIYLLSDTHVRERVCPDPDAKPVRIDEFLARTFEDNKDKTIDFFVEHGFIPKHGKSKTVFNKESYLKDVKDHFASCWTQDRELFAKECPYLNVRFHRVDMRYYLEPSRTTVMLQSRIIRALGDNSKATRDQKMDRIRQLSIRLMTHLEERDLLTILGDNKTLKQFANIGDEQLRKLTSKYWISRGSILYERLKILLPKLVELPNSTFGKFYEPHRTLIREIMRATFDFQIFLMDAYTMGRVLRSFNSVSGEQSETPRHIIIYVGGEHADNYAEFFRYLGIKLIGRNVSDNKEASDFQCVHLGLKLPFFHHRPHD